MSLLSHLGWSAYRVCLEQSIWKIRSPVLCPGQTGFCLLSCSFWPWMFGKKWSVNSHGMIVKLALGVRAAGDPGRLWHLVVTLTSHLPGWTSFPPMERRTFPWLMWPYLCFPASWRPRVLGPSQNCSFSWFAKIKSVGTLLCISVHASHSPPPPPPRCHSCHSLLQLLSDN